MSKWYGNIYNRIEENQNLDCEKKVGGLLTEFCWSDRRPYEIVKVVNQKDLFIRELKHRKVDDEPMSNNWELYSDDDNKHLEHLVYRYNHWYKKYLNPFTNKSTYHKVNVTFGYAEYYYDYEF